VESLAKKNSELENDLQKARKHNIETLEKLQDMEAKHMQLKRNLQRCVVTWYRWFKISFSNKTVLTCWNCSYSPISRYI